MKTTALPYVIKAACIATAMALIITLALSCIDTAHGQVKPVPPMPPATPIYEQATALRSLSIPILCKGKSRHGLWIRHGERTGVRLPIPKCV